MRLLVAYLAIVGLLCCLWQAHAQLTITGVGGGFGAAGGGVYAGPGNVVSGASAWWGIRAYSTATRGNKVANVCNSTGGADVGCADMFSDATTGIIVPATISSITCPGANCTIKTLYDQTGANTCSGAACDLTQGTVGSRLLLTASCFGALACGDGSTQTPAYTTGSTTFTIAQPYTFSGVYKRTSNFTSFGDWLACIGTGVQAQALTNSSVNSMALYTGSAIPAVTSADSTAHATQLVFNGSSSIGSIDGSDTTGLSLGNTASCGAGAGSNFRVGISFGGFRGDLNEFGVWPVGFTSTTQTSAMSANQRAFWGF